jgi:prepilin-type N-terminal cleavage/methylation domain-containing protein
MYKIMNRLKNKSFFLGGFSLIELIIVMAILGILVRIAVISFGNQSGSAALNATTISVISILNEAKSQAVSSKNASNYGVRIFSNKLVSFENNYGTNNKTFTISSLTKISTSTGIGADIIFNNVSGSTSASGTITVATLRDPTKNSIINVYSTGDIEKN